MEKPLQCVPQFGYAMVDVFNTSLDHPMDMLIFCRLSSKDLPKVNIIHVLHRKDCGWMVPPLWLIKNYIKGWQGFNKAMCMIIFHSPFLCTNDVILWASELEGIFLEFSFGCIHGKRSYLPQGLCFFKFETWPPCFR